MNRYATKDCDCPDVVIGTGGRRPEKCEEHGNRYLSATELQKLHPASGGEGRSTTRRSAVSVADPEGWVQSVRDTPPSKLRRRPMKRSNGFKTSPVQQRATKGRACIVCGKDEAEAIIDPAHVTPRRLAPHCTCEKGTVPLCRGCHNRYDDLNDPFDLLPYLMTHKLYEETVHGFLEHGVSLRELMDTITGVKWAPAERSAA